MNVSPIRQGNSSTFFFNLTVSLKRNQLKIFRGNTTQVDLLTNVNKKSYSNNSLLITDFYKIFRCVIQGSYSTSLNFSLTGL